MTKIFITILFVVTSGSLFGQGAGVNEPVTVGTGLTWNLVIYKAGKPKAKTLIFFPGLGEVGTDTSALISNGPSAMIKNGWKGYVNGEKWNIISVQSVTGTGTNTNVNRLVDSIIARYDPDTCQMYMTGLSLGGARALVRTATTMTNIRWWRFPAIVAMSSHTAPAADSIQQFRTWTQNGGRFWGLIGNSDSAGRPLTMDLYRFMNSVVPGSAISYVYSGGHSGWNTYYDTAWRSFNGKNVYEWLDMHSKRPYASAGTNIINTSNTSVTLNGITKRYAGGKDGWNNTITWSKLSGPSATINNPNSDTTTVDLTGGVGTYIFRITSANASGGLSATHDVTVIFSTTPPNSTGAGIKLRRKKWNVEATE